MKCSAKKGEREKERDENLSLRTCRFGRVVKNDARKRSELPLYTLRAVADNVTPLITGDYS